MIEMTKRERVRAALAGGAVDHVPTALWRHDFLREWSAEELVAATLDAYRADDWDFIKFNPRATYFAEAWGNAYERPREQRQPRLTAAAIHDVSGLASLAPLDPRQGVFREHLQALWMLVGEVGDEVDIIQTIFSPLRRRDALRFRCRLPRVRGGRCRCGTCRSRRCNDDPRGVRASMHRRGRRRCLLRAAVVGESRHLRRGLLSRVRTPV